MLGRQADATWDDKSPLISSIVHDADGIMVGQHWPEGSMLIVAFLAPRCEL